MPPEVLLVSFIWIYKMSSIPTGNVTLAKVNMNGGPASKFPNQWDAVDVGKVSVGTGGEME